ncbi:MAG: hypothetical protein E7328_02450 [Clostridiales bacterium]|nr:hypothetical protein [Clostridiales bacterium]
MKKAYQELKLGMTMAEVVALFGRPDSEGVRDGVVTLGWETQEFKGVLRGGRVTRSVEVELKDDKVIAFNGHNINISVV